MAHRMITPNPNRSTSSVDGPSTGPLQSQALDELLTARLERLRQAHEDCLILQTWIGLAMDEECGADIACREPALEPLKGRRHRRNARAVRQRGSREPWDGRDLHDRDN